MKKSELQELRSKPIEDLVQSVQAHREELMQGRFKRVSQGEGLGVKGRALRRNIARLQTIISEKKAQAAKA
jgi:ribosomal protein L29